MYINIHPCFNKPFQIHINENKTQFRHDLSQEGSYIAFCSRTLNYVQIRYTVTEIEQNNSCRNSRRDQKYCARSKIRHVY